MASPLLVQLERAFLKPAFLDLAKKRRIDQGEKKDLFAARRAYVMVQAYYFDPGDFLDHCFQDRPGSFGEMSSNLFDEVASLLS